jgi:hypothetical protein
LPKPEEQREDKLGEFKQAYSEIHNQLQDEFDIQLKPYYANNKDREKAVSTLLLAVQESTNMKISEIEPLI